MSKPPRKANTRDTEALQHWRLVLPGVPDEQIVIPRYCAKGSTFPVPSDVGDVRVPAHVEWLIGRTVEMNVRPEERGAFAAGIKRVSGNE